MLLMALLALAGCTSSPAPDTEATAADTEAIDSASILHRGDEILGPGTATGVLLHTGHQAIEPTIGAYGGKVFMTGFAEAEVCSGCPADARRHVEMSPNVIMTADGRTFDLIYPLLPEDLGSKRTNDPMLHVDADHGRVFMDDMFPAATCDVLSFTDDEGASWTTNPVACGTPVTDHQNLVTAPPRHLTTVGYPELVYKCAQVPGAAPMCAVSPTGGLTFLPKVPVWTPGQAPACSTISHHAEAGPDGRVYLPFGACRDGLHVFKTEDDGLTWSDHLVADEAWLVDNGHDFDLAVDEDGNVYAVWPHANQLWLSVSQDHAETWSAPRPLAAPGVTGTSYQAVDAAAPGQIAFVYYGTTEPGGPLNTSLPSLPDPEYLEVFLNGVDGWENHTWNAYIGVMHDALDPESPIQTVRLHPGDDPVARGACMVYYGCHGVREFIDIVIDEDGRPWAAIVDTCTTACVTDPTVMQDGLAAAMGTLSVGPGLQGTALDDLGLSTGQRAT